MFKHSMTTLRHICFAIVLTMLSGQNAWSAPGTLPDAPLFLSTLVEPNIFVTLDDSGSMHVMTLVESGISGFSTLDGIPRVNGRLRAYITPESAFTYPYDGPFPGFLNSLPPADGSDPEWDATWIFRSHIGNKIYYNPDPAVSYDPWPGADAAGVALYPVITSSNTAGFTRVPKLAYERNPSVTDHTQWTGETIDLTDFHSFTENNSSGNSVTSNKFYIPTYFEWIDSNGNGDIESSDSATMYYVGNPATTPTGPTGFTVMQDPDPSAMQKFANWFVYHRSRMGIAKFIIGRTINNTDAARMGMWLFNHGLLANIDSMSLPAQKEALLKAFYEYEVPIGGTPGRTALEKVGDYFTTTTAGAPILPTADGGECQQNFNIFMSDGFWNGTNPGVGNADGDKSSDYDGDDGRSTVLNDTSNDEGNYADGFSNTLADVAMHYYETDLRPTLNNNVPTQTGIDENTQQHLVNYTVGFGINGRLDPLTLDPLAAGFTWPEPTAGSIETVDDLWHASYNSRGRHLSADDPQALQVALDAAVNDISERIGTAAAVAVNSAQLSLESVVYLAQFDSNRWQGNLLALPIIFDPVTGTTNGELGAPKWEASSLLAARDINNNPRSIITFNDAPAVNDGVAFQWTSISSDMKDDLRRNPAGGIDSDTIAEARLDYLRGDRSNEGAGFSFRPRLSLLGDIVNSGPVFVGEPNLSWPDFAPFPTGLSAYSEFKNSNAKNRKRMVYIGANDGMLHAFDDDSGEEVFGYIPGMLASTGIADGLHYLTDPNYLHKFYVDLTPTLSDVFIGDNTAAKKWRTVLVGAMRGGARGIYALDVTDPATFSEANADDIVLWEFTNTSGATASVNADLADLGYTYSRPFIALANNNTWVAIFGNGYNPDPGLSGVTGEASLFIVNIEAGTDGKWQASDFTKISTGVGTPADPNGLTTPALADIDGNGTVDRVYAGDLEGNMWVFDLESANPSQWGVAYKSGSTPAPLFTADLNRPITGQPVLAKHPTQPDSSSPSNAPNIMVYFGTGQYLVDADKSSTNVNSYYGVWDQGDSSLTSADLIEQFFETGFTDNDGNAAKVITRNAIDYSIDHGWHFKFDESGERSVTASIARADTVFFNSFVPADDPCSVGGFGFRYAVDMTTGGSALATDPVFDSDHNGVIDENDTVSNGIRESTVAAERQEGYLPQPVFVENSKDSLAFTGEESTKIKGLKDIPTGRFSWQELLQ